MNWGKRVLPFGVNKETKRMQIRTVVCLALLAGVLFCCSDAQAQSSDYKFQVTPYAFMTGVNGTIGEAGRTANVDASFNDVLHHLKMVAMVYFDARFGRWRALADNLQTDVRDGEQTGGD